MDQCHELPKWAWYNIPALCSTQSSGDLKRHKEQESTTVSHQCVWECEDSWSNGGRLKQMGRQAVASSIPPGSHIVCPEMLFLLTSDLCGVKEWADCDVTLMSSVTHGKIVTLLEVFQENYLSGALNASVSAESTSLLQLLFMKWEVLYFNSKTPQIFLLLSWYEISMQQIITRGIHLIKTIYSETIKWSSLTIFIEMLCKWSANNVKSLLGNCSGGKYLLMVAWLELSLM